MAINRRNVLVGLGAIVGGGGALIGTGAFSSVSAARSVSVTTAGDDSAYLQIEGDGDYVTNTGSEDLSIDLGSATAGLNEEAITTLSAGVTITNNAADDSTTDVSLATGSADSYTGQTGELTILVTTDGSGSIAADNSNGAVVTFKLISNGGSNTDGDTQTLDPTGTASTDVDITIDTRNSEVGSEKTAGTNVTSQIVVVAE